MHVWILRGLVQIMGNANVWKSPGATPNINLYVIEYIYFREHMPKIAYFLTQHTVRRLSHLLGKIPSKKEIFLPQNQSCWEVPACQLSISSTKREISTKLRRSKVDEFYNCLFGFRQN